MNNEKLRDNSKKITTHKRSYLIIKDPTLILILIRLNACYNFVE